MLWAEDVMASYRRRWKKWFCSALSRGNKSACSDLTASVSSWVAITKDYNSRKSFLGRGPLLY